MKLLCTYVSWCSNETQIQFNNCIVRRYYFLPLNGTYSDLRLKCTSPLDLLINYFTRPCSSADYTHWWTLAHHLPYMLVQQLWTFNSCQLSTVSVNNCEVWSYLCIYLNGIHSDLLLGCTLLIGIQGAHSSLGSRVHTPHWDLGAHSSLGSRVQKDVRPGFLAGNSICQHCIHSKLQNEPQRGYKETNVVHFSHCYRLNFDKPCDALFRWSSLIKSGLIL